MQPPSLTGYTWLTIRSYALYEDHDHRGMGYIRPWAIVKTNYVRDGIHLTTCDYILYSYGLVHRASHVVGFNHGLPWCVKYMARGPPVTTKPDGEAGGFCGDRRPEGHVFHTSRQAMIKTYYSTSIRKTMVQNCSYFTQMKSTTTAIDDSNRRRNKLGLGCSRDATAPLILIFELLFLWLNIGRHFKGITQFHNCHSPKHTSKKYYPVINIFREICTKIIT